MSSYPNSVGDAGGDGRGTPRDFQRALRRERMARPADPYAPSVPFKPAPYMPGEYRPLMPFGPNAPVAGVSRSSGAPVPIADLYRQAGIIEGEYRVVGTRAMSAGLLGRLARAAGIAARATPWGRLLDLLQLGSELWDLYQAHPGGAQRVPSGWQSGITCNPVSYGQQVITGEVASWPLSCLVFQAITPGFSPNDRSMVLWYSANPAGTRWNVKQVWKYPSPQPLPNPGPVTWSLPVNVPVTFPNAAMFDPMSLPIGQPVGTPIQRPYSMRSAMPSSWWSEVSYGPSRRLQTQTEVAVVLGPPGTPGRVVTRPAANSMPPRDHKERKFRLSNRLAAAMRVVGITTEAFDVVDCLHGALPKELRAKPVRLDRPRDVAGAFAGRYFGKGRYRPPTPAEKVAAVWRHLDQVDAGKFQDCILIEDVQDNIIGEASQGARKATPDRPVGWLAGPAL